MFTAGAAWTVDLAARGARGRAIGLFGLTIWSALTVGPLIGEGLRQAVGYDAVWAFAAIAPLAGALVARTLPDTSRAARTRRARLARGPRAALRPGIVAVARDVRLGGLRRVHRPAPREARRRATARRCSSRSRPRWWRPRSRRPAAGRRRPAHDRRGRRAAPRRPGSRSSAARQGLAGGGGGAVVMGFGFSVLFPSLALIVVSAAGRRPPRRRAGDVHRVLRHRHGARRAARRHDRRARRLPGGLLGRRGRRGPRRPDHRAARRRSRAPARARTRSRCRARWPATRSRACRCPSTGPARRRAAARCRRWFGPAARPGAACAAPRWRWRSGARCRAGRS